MPLSRRTLLKETLTGAGLGWLGVKTKKYAERTIGTLTGAERILSIDDIVHGHGKEQTPETHVELVRKISEDLSVPEKNIHALLIQERAAGQKTDFFSGQEFGQDAGKPAILFERHTFWQALARCGKNMGIHTAPDLPTLLFRTSQHDGLILSQSGYGKSAEFEHSKQSEQYPKLRKAYEMGAKFAETIAAQTGKDPVKIQKAIEDSALMACSWGAGQILGINYRDLGYSSVQELVQNSSTVHGMAENFEKFIHHRGQITHEGKKVNYLDELQKRNPDWHVIGKFHNGAGVPASYVQKVEAYAAQYSTRYRQDLVSSGIAGVSVGAFVAAILNMGHNFRRTYMSKKTPDKGMTRRRLLKLASLGSLGTIVGSIGGRALDNAGSMIPSLPDFHLGENTKKVQEGKINPEAIFTKKVDLTIPATPTKIQTPILNPWLEKNKKTVPRFKTIKEAKEGKGIIRMNPQTEAFICEGLGSSLIQRIEQRKKGNHPDYLYIHEQACQEIENIARVLNSMAQEVLGMQEGYHIRLIITSALRDSKYSTKFLGNSSPNSTHNTGRAFDIAERFEISDNNGNRCEINAKSYPEICKNLRALLAAELNKRNKREIYFMREGNPPHLHCVALAGTAL